MVNALCREFSPALVEEGSVGYHPFPPPSALTGPTVPATLRALGFGYRAEFIHRTANLLVDAHSTPEKFLLSLRTLPTPTAREELLKFVGVGRKVADCVLLMSLDKREVVPVDTHVLQIAMKHYGFKNGAKGKGGGKVSMTPVLYEQVNERLAGVWGEYAGWAHSVSNESFPSNAFFIKSCYI